MKDIIFFQKKKLSFYIKFFIKTQNSSKKISELKTDLMHKTSLIMEKENHIKKLALDPLEV